MSYAHEMAIQFKDKQTAEQFIADLEVELECEPTLFNEVDKYIDFKSNCGDIYPIYYWRTIYETDPELHAIEDLLNTEQYDAIKVRIGELTDDIEEITYGTELLGCDEIWIKRRIGIGYDD